jgi:hypothetical protein
MRIVLDKGKKQVRMWVKVEQNGSDWKEVDGSRAR